MEDMSHPSQVFPLTVLLIKLLLLLVFVKHAMAVHIFGKSDLVPPDSA